MEDPMRIDIHHHIHFEPDPDTVRFQHEVLGLLHSIIQKETDMSVELDRLTTEVTETRGVVDSAIALIASLADQIRALMNDPAALSALADSLDASQADLAAAVAANSPAAPPVEPPPVDPGV